jgi:hypothetical protein
MTAKERTPSTETKTQRRAGFPAPEVQTPKGRLKKLTEVEVEQLKVWLRNLN